MSTESRTPLIERAAGSSFIKACFNGTNAFLGIGLLTVPYALSSGGWLSLSLFLLVSLITFYTGLLLKRCLDMDPSIQSYLDIAERAYGTAGRIAVSVIMNAELYIVSIGLIIMEGDNLHKLFPNFMINFKHLAVDGPRTFMLITGLVISPTMLLTDLGILSYVSATGVISCLVILLSVVCVGADASSNQGTTILRLTGLPTAVSLYIVCFAGHPVIPSIYTSMRRPYQFSRVLLFSFILSTLTYLSMAVVSYLMYGNDIQSQITLNLPTSSVASQVAIYTTLLIPITRYALMMTPVANAIEQGGWLSQHHKENKLVRRLIRLALLLTTVVFAYLFPHFETLMSIVGSVFVVLASFLLPCLCYLKISGIFYQGFTFNLAFIVGIMVFATLAGLIGTCSSIAELILE